MDLRAALLAWYEPRRRAYPWRRPADPRRAPLRGSALPDAPRSRGSALSYRVLVSEVMLQQTQASRVAPAFRAFLRRFPTVAVLARASRAEVLRAWDGLGYNRRAVALSEAARAIVRDHGGRVPSGVEDLIRLPGVGPYTAAAVASIAFRAEVPALDTNVRRVVSRALLGADPHEVPEEAIRRAAGRWLSPRDPGAWNQAAMDLGREVCRPVPRCAVCPLAWGCRFRALGRVPRPAVRRQQPFEGSTRQLRGRVVRSLRVRPSATLATLAREAGTSLDRVAAAVSALAAEGLVEAGPAALAGSAAGRVRLAS